MSDVDALKLLQDDLKEEDYEGIIQAINRVITVAIALGPIRTRNQLIPFLVEFSETDNDEAQTAVARQLGDMTDLIGGTTHLWNLLPLLEKYCGEEEFVVRDTAVQSLNKIIPLLPKPDLINKFIPILQRLANGDWFTTRVSATGLFAVCYPLIPENIQAELRSLFNNLCNDDTPMVRKAAFTQLGNYALTLQRTHYKSDIYPIIKAIAIDDMDSMRQYAIDACAALGKVIDATEYVSVILPIIEGLQDDNSWRVRQSLATHYVSVCQNTASYEQVGKRLFVTFMKLLKDKEAEVRAAACEHLDNVMLALAKEPVNTSNPATSTSPLPASSSSSSSSSVNPIPASAAILSLRDLLESHQSTLEALASDPSQNVKVAYSRTLVGLCPVLGSALSIKMLIPILTQLAKDEYYEVRHFIFSRLSILIDYIGPTQLSTLLLPMIIDMSKDQKWRVRYQIIEKCYLLAQCLGVKVFEKKILPLLIHLLSDHVFAIRQLACKQLGMIMKQPSYGAKWAIEKMLPQAFVLYDKTTNYLHRMTCLLLIEEMVKTQRMELISEYNQIDSSIYANDKQFLIQADDSDDDDNDVQVDADLHGTTAASTNVISKDLSSSHHPSQSLSSYDSSSSSSSSSSPDDQNHALSADQLRADFSLLIDSYCLPLIIQACTDDVPNVRLAAAKCLITLLHSHKVEKATIAQKFGSFLDNMCQDVDPDVSYFAHVAKRKCRA